MTAADEQTLLSLQQEREKDIFSKMENMHRSSPFDLSSKLSDEENEALTNVYSFKVERFIKTLFIILEHHQFLDANDLSILTDKNKSLELFYLSYPLLTPAGTGASGRYYTNFRVNFQNIDYEVTNDIYLPGNTKGRRENKSPILAWVLSVITRRKQTSMTPTNQKYINTWNQNIYYGVPGCGKSYKIDNDLDSIGIPKTLKEQNTARVVFHPDFSNSDFIGQILPSLKQGNVEYRFNPGEFTKILRSAYENPTKSYALIIEEVNRGNAAAIFGELFQLMDRKEQGEDEGIYIEGWSSYSVMNDNINAYIRGLYDDTPTVLNPLLPWFTDKTGIRLPPNLSLMATMNTSDQNVFKLDNAFKRRWNLEMIPNKFNFDCEDADELNKQKQQCNAKIEGFNKLTWGIFREAVNSYITDPNSGNETSSFADKQLGTWFVKVDANGSIPQKTFTNKVLEYLWDDVFTDDFTIFNPEYKTLSQIIEDVEKGKSDSIFTDSFKDLLENAKAELLNAQGISEEDEDPLEITDSQ